MGSSTVAQLIAKGKAENKYNNAGISSDPQWMDFFNDALRDLVDDLQITKVGTLSVVAGTREYDLPDDYYAMVLMFDSSNMNVVKRRNYNQQYPPGYWIFNRGSGHVIDMYNYSSAVTMTYTYLAYAAELTATSDYPEIPGVGERALIYYALSKALKNQNQVGQAKEMEALYERERMKIRSAAARGAG
ncbi:hypothetical protein MO973_19555 [Paenibacillus sp. TRM 82003]|nr:hypothetical protein [Paenibacillus sp. TRM 82003]